MLKKKYITVLALTILGLLSTACSSAPVSTAQNAKPSAPAQATATKPTVTAIKFGTAPGLKPLAERTGKVSKVYFTRDISGTGLKKIYDKINQNMTGKIAVKLHTGEPNGPYILDRTMVKNFLSGVPNSIIVECNVLYPSPRQNTQGHRETLKTNGWTFCPVDIMDADGTAMLPIKGGKQLTEVSVGSHELNYDSM